MGVPSNFKGVKGKSGRSGIADVNIQEFKRLAWGLIVKRCSVKGAGGEKWIDKYTVMFAGKMMPQQVEGIGEEGEIKIDISIQKMIDKVYGANGKIHSDSA